MPGRSITVHPPPASPVGSVIPSRTPHAVSVSLPTWQDNVDYEEGAQRIKDSMKSGYPRFYIHHQIDELAQVANQLHGAPSELCILLPTLKTAHSCQAFLSTRSPAVPSRIVEFAVQPLGTSPQLHSDPNASARARKIALFPCFFNAENFPKAKEFWQHSGDGISSRVAERCLILLGKLENESTGDSTALVEIVEEQVEPVSPTFVQSAISSRYGTKGGRYGVSSKPLAPILPPTSTPSLPIHLSSKSRYSTVQPSRVRQTDSAASTASQDSSSPSSLSNSLDSDSLHTASSRPSSCPPPTLAQTEQDEDVLSRYVEERYGRNLDLSLAPLAKLAMRRRIAGVLRESEGNSTPVEIEREGERVVNSSRGIEALTEKDVWLYPCGMSAIFHAHQLVMKAKDREGGPAGKSVCFGFPYTDTLKILEKWGSGCEFFGNGLASDLPALRELLVKADPPILALFCEFPSNPLLRTPPLVELRKLADEFGFLIVIDETIAGFVNVEVLPLADVVVSSLTKVFSGDSNVMGGSLVLNPKSPKYASLKSTQETIYEDTYFDEDAIYMERNSRDFQERIRRENHNASLLCDLLLSRRTPGPCPPGIDATRLPPFVPNSRSPVIKNVYYPRFMTPENYEACLRTSDSSDNSTPAGYGGLFSITFTSLVASKTFFDALPCYKGPSLGTNFTLACPYTILAHYGEQEWAGKWGVEAGLVRVSTGLEEETVLREWFVRALEKAERAVESLGRGGE